MRAEIRRLLDRAAAEADRTMRRGHGGPFGAVIARGGRVLAVASNTVLKQGDPTCHAEMNAIRIAAKKLRSPFLDGADIFSTTEPCPMCFSAIHWARIARVFYSTGIPDVKRLGFNELTIPNPLMKRLGRSPVVLKRVPNAACRRLLASFAALPARRLY